MKKPRVSLADPNTMSTDMPQFDDAKRAMGRNCTFPIAKTTDGRMFTNGNGTIAAVDSRPFKGGKDAVYVGIKIVDEPMLLYCEFCTVVVSPPEGARPGPVVPGYMKT